MRYWKIHLGSANSLAQLGLRQNIIGVGYDMPNLTELNLLGPNLKERVKELYLQTHSQATKMQVASGAGAVLRFIATMQIGDVVIVPLGDSTYRVGKINSDYFFSNEEELAHRRSVEWFGTIAKENFTETLKNTLGAIGTISDVTHQSNEIEALLSGNMSRIENIQNQVDQSEFALEKHLEEFIISNWNKLDISRDYSLYRDENGELAAQQYQTEVGPIDILAIKKDKTEILIIELKKGRSGDAVVGQILRYITAVKKELAEDNQKVRGLIITGSDDKKIRYSIEPLGGLVDFYMYEMSFGLKNLLQT